MGLAGTRPGEQRPTAASAGPSPASAVRFGVALAPRQLRAEPVRPRPAGSPANCGPRPSRQGHATVFPKFAQVKSDASSWNPLIEDHCSGRIHVHANGTRFGAENAYPKERTKETLVGSNGSLHEPRVWQKSDSMQRQPRRVRSYRGARKRRRDVVRESDPTMPHLPRQDRQR